MIGEVYVSWLIIILDSQNEFKNREDILDRAWQVLNWSDFHMKIVLLFEAMTTTVTMPPFHSVNALALYDFKTTDYTCC